MAASISINACAVAMNGVAARRSLQPALNAKRRTGIDPERDKKLELFIDHEFRSLIPALQPEELAELERSLIAEGNRVPIDTWKGYIIDGHNRYDICQKHNLPLKPANELKLANKEEAKIWIIRNQFGRRNLSLYQRSVLALKLEFIFSEKAREKQRLAGKEKLLQSSVEAIKTQNELAKLARVSHDTIAKVKVIEARATPEQKEQLNRGTASASINKIYNKIKGDTFATNYTNEHTKIKGNASILMGKMEDIVPTLGKFDLIIADPPYNVTEYEWDKVKDYLQCTERWLAICKSALSDHSHLFWFCSPHYMADIEMLFRKLELPIKSRIVWHRRNMAMGSIANDQFIDSWEMIFHTGNTLLHIPDKWDSSRFDVQTFAVPQTNFTDTKLHPTQKPLALIQWLIRFGAFKDSRILDPFAGSGTTGMACNSNDCVLIERNEEYVKIAKQRLGIL